MTPHLRRRGPDIETTLLFFSARRTRRSLVWSRVCEQRSLSAASEWRLPDPQKCPTDAVHTLRRQSGVDGDGARRRQFARVVPTAAAHRLPRRQPNHAPCDTGTIGVSKGQASSIRLSENPVNGQDAQARTDFSICLGLGDPGAKPDQTKASGVSAPWTLSATKLSVSGINSRLPASRFRWPLARVRSGVSAPADGRTLIAFRALVKCPVAKTTGTTNAMVCLSARNARPAFREDAGQRVNEGGPARCCKHRNGAWTDHLTEEIDRGPSWTTEQKHAYTTAVTGPGGSCCPGRRRHLRHRRAEPVRRAAGSLPGWTETPSTSDDGTTDGLTEILT